MQVSALMNVMSAAVIKAGKGLVRDFGEVDQLHISRKGAANFVTATDVRTEKFLQKELSKARPEYGFLMEEGGEVEPKDGMHRWIIDPLDGTSNFIHAIPYFCISVGLERTQNGKAEMLAGVIFDPIHNELFMAEKGKGAWLGNRRLHVSGRSNLEDAMLVTGSLKLPKSANPHAAAMHNATTLQLHTSLRYFGAAALDLAHLAAGRIDSCWYYSIQPWDIAAGVLMVQEAGGMVTELSGQPAHTKSDNLLASNSLLHPPLHKLISQKAIAS